MWFLMLVDLALLFHEVEKCVQSATSHKCKRFFIHLHSLEEDLLP